MTRQLTTFTRLALAGPLPAPDLYNATILEVHDGDTFDVKIAWGRRRFDEPVPIRLMGCNAAELGTPGGDAAAVNLQALLPPGTPVLLSAAEDDKFAPRWDAQVGYVPLGPGGIRDLVVDLVAQHWAAVWNGRGPRPLPPWPRPPATERMWVSDANTVVAQAVTEWQAAA